MRGRRHPWLNLILFVAVLASGSSAKAQAWLADRQRAEGRGIRLGDFELHPGIGAEFGYYSNPFYADKDITSSAALRAAAHLFLSTLQGERVERDRAVKATPGWIDLRGGISAAYQHYFLDFARDALNADLNLAATIAPQRPVSLRVTEMLRRSALPFGQTSAQPASVPPGTVFTPVSPDYTNYYENAGVQLLFQSAGGLLQGGIGYRFGYYWFQSAGFLFNNNLTHSATLNLAWEFLPKTALFYDATFTHQTYPNLGKQSAEQSALTALSNNNQLNSRIGLNGAITSRIGATVAVGYGAGAYDVGKDPQGVIGNVEVRYKPNEIAELSLTFDRQFMPSYQGNFQDVNRIWARTRWLFVGALLVAARGGVEFLNYGFDVRQNQARDDIRYFAEVSAEYRFVDWFALTTQFNLLVDSTDFNYHVPIDSAAQAPNAPIVTNFISDPARFTAIEAWIGLRVFL